MDRGAFLSALLLLLGGGRAAGDEGQAGPPYVVCGVGSTMWEGDGPSGRAGGGRRAFAPGDMDPQLCDHFLFLLKGFEAVAAAAAEDDASGGSRRIKDEFFKRGMELRTRPFERQLMAYIDMDLPHAAVPEANDEIETLANHTARFLRRHGLDGLTLNCKDLSGNKLKYLKVLRAFRIEFSKQDLLLATSLPKQSRDLYEDEEILELVSHSNYILVDTAIYWDASSNVTGLHAPIQSVNETVQWYLRRGVPKEMMVLSVAVAAVTARLKDKTRFKVGAEIDGPGFESPYSYLGDGVISFTEMMIKLNGYNDRWELWRDYVSTSAYGYNKDGIWASFDDPHSIEIKGDFVRSTGLAGALMWLLEMDNFSGYGGGVVNPFVRSFAECLRRRP